MLIFQVICARSIAYPLKTLATLPLSHYNVIIVKKILGDLLMVRISKQGKIRHRCPRRPRPPATKTGPLKDNLTLGFKAHTNGIEGSLAQTSFIPKIK